MAIIGFWSASKKETGQTLAATAIATYIGVKHNYKILLVDATFDDDTMERCYWNVNKKNDAAKMLNKGKMDIASGAEGLVSAVASNKTTPEIITNYTRVVLRSRLDVLCGLKTKIPEEFNKSLMLYKDLLTAADKYYDLVLVDMEKTYNKETTKAILGISHVLVCDFTQNYKQIEEYYAALNNPKMDFVNKNKVIPMLTNADDNSKLNTKNVARILKEKNLMTIPYNSVFKDVASEAGVTNFFLRYGINPNTNDKNAYFIKCLDDVDKAIDSKLRELKYKI